MAAVVCVGVYPLPEAPPSALAKPKVAGANREPIVAPRASHLACRRGGARTPHALGSRCLPDRGFVLLLHGAPHCSRHRPRTAAPTQALVSDSFSLQYCSVSLCRTKRKFFSVTRARVTSGKNPESNHQASVLGSTADASLNPAAAAFADGDIRPRRATKPVPRNFADAWLTQWTRCG